MNNFEQQSAGALPGFEDLVKTAVDRAGSVDLHDNRHTAATVLRDYPETFKSVAAAIFKYNLPNRVIRDLYRMNGATVKGIHDMVMGAAATGVRGDFLVKCRAASTKNIVITRLLDAILDKLDDPSTVAKMDVEQLTRLLNQLSPHEQPEQTTKASRTDVTIVEPATDFESIMNGLILKKNPASLEGSTEGEHDDFGNAPGGLDGATGEPSVCSTRNDSSSVSSYEMNYRSGKSLGNIRGRCNGLCKPVADGSELGDLIGSDGDCDVGSIGPGKSSDRDGSVQASDNLHQGAGGSPGAPERGGSN